MRSAASLARSALNAVLPVRCMLCGATVAEGGALCGACWGEFMFLGSPAYACCGYPFEYEVPVESLCAACTRRAPRFDRARAVFAYDDTSRALILSFKHADQTHQAPAFGQWLARAGAALIADTDLVVPVPLHRWRLFHPALQPGRLAGLRVRPGDSETCRRRSLAAASSDAVAGPFVADSADSYC